MTYSLKSDSVATPLQPAVEDLRVRKSHKLQTAATVKYAFPFKAEGVSPKYNTCKNMVKQTHRQEDGRGKKCSHTKQDADPQEKIGKDVKAPNGVVLCVLPSMKLKVESANGSYTTACISLQYDYRFVPSQRHRQPCDFVFPIKIFALQETSCLSPFLPQAGPSPYDNRHAIEKEIEGNLYIRIHTCAFVAFRQGLYQHEDSALFLAPNHTAIASAMIKVCVCVSNCPSQEKTDPISLSLRYGVCIRGGRG